MELMVRLRSFRWLAGVILGIVIVPYLGTVALAAKTTATPARTLILFPLDDNTGVTKPKLVKDLGDALHESLCAFPKYQVVRYDYRLPAIQRFIAMQPDKKVTAEGPFSGNPTAVGRAISFAKLMSADLALVGYIEKYSFSDSQGAVEIIATIHILDVRTGKSLETVPIIGRAARPAGEITGTEDTIAIVAVKDVVRQVVEKLGGPSDITATKEQKQEARRSNKKAWVPWLLLSLGVGLMLGGGSSGNGGAADAGSDVEPCPLPPPGW